MDEWDFEDPDIGFHESFGYPRRELEDPIDRFWDRHGALVGLAATLATFVGFGLACYWCLSLALGR